MRFSEITDVTISLNPEDSTNCSESKRREIAELLFKLCKNKHLINVMRTLALCPICKKRCTYAPYVGSQTMSFPDSSILDSRAGFDIIIPIQIIHILSEHCEVDFDSKILGFYPHSEPHPLYQTL